MNLGIDKIIFLDIDHVLTNVNVDNTSFLSYDPTKYKLSEYNLKNLNMILKSTGASIVIASNWRRFIFPDIYWEFNGKRFMSPLESFKKAYSSKIIGMLPVERHATKCECLDLWFEDNPWFSKKGCYVILEDDLNERYQAHPIFRKHLILTDFRTGLTSKDANSAIHILESEVQ